MRTRRVAIIAMGVTTAAFAALMFYAFLVSTAHGQDAPKIQVPKFDAGKLLESGALTWVSSSSWVSAGSWLSVAAKSNEFKPGDVTISSTKEPTVAKRENTWLITFKP